MGKDVPAANGVTDRRVGLLFRARTWSQEASEQLSSAIQAAAPGALAQSILGSIQKRIDEIVQ
ncbi:hypothetical protein AK812_SmicGene45027, partial [Symbiodinium microadriaticum]